MNNNNIIISLKNTLLIQQEWRIEEITALKTIPYKNNISKENRIILFKYSIPAFYSLWEGYVESALQEYIIMINSLNLSHDDLHPKIIAHDIDMKHQLKNGRSNMNKKIEFCINLQQYFSNQISISLTIPRKSNVDFKTINDILESFNLKKICKHKYEIKINNLIKYRNSISHGENSLKVTDKEIMDFSNTIIECMDAVYDSIIDGATNKLYLK